MRIEDEKSRQFYANECVKSNWSVRQLKRQIGSFYYERLLASQDIEAVEKEIGLPEKVEFKNIIRVPYVLEISGLEGKTSFYEKDLEQAIIDHLQKFLLELGRGFSFVSRQQKITFDGRHFFIDLVFYNYILKCFVIIDLKLGDLTHQDNNQIFASKYKLYLPTEEFKKELNLENYVKKDDSLEDNSLTKKDE